MLIIKSILKPLWANKACPQATPFCKLAAMVFCQEEKADLEQEGETKPTHGEETRGQSWQPSGGWFQLLLSPCRILGPFFGLFFHFSAESVTCVGVHPINPALWCELMCLTFLSLPANGVPTDCMEWLWKYTYNPSPGTRTQAEPGRKR